MGADYCAEHEWGVQEMKDTLGCDATQDGIERRRVRTLPPELRKHSTAKLDSIFLTPLEWFYAQPDALLQTELRPLNASEKLLCAWDERTFGIAAYDTENRARVTELWDAFLRKDIAFWSPSAGLLVRGAGLIFVIISRLPEVELKAVLDADQDRQRLQREADKLGVEKALRDGGKHWFALVPGWADNRKESIRFYLNPLEQHLTNSGWFTEEELRLWLKDEGPVLKTTKKKPQRRSAR